MYAVAELDFVEPLIAFRRGSTNSVNCGWTHCGNAAV